ncbi:riboflavin synthase [Acetobacter oeni]|uniref:Riboflavin synthase n=1 Tax=Acetobacter oeni TaxID=304077 RepID=A0A511XM21_9PROT|nr:riboflavin synthase [Acetobacter oeni]MBB3884006.1 riboflavin synthase [Acetobacter oeni]NHO20064.1 riboflavin synthase [Acetobacter oeni]GBR03778.1 riboflavin synthase subunit alpha [Acetobacter oeni LMG 21952]GEN63995.1 riboflavin synthase subunit alpha [Acetobacter oeni]
MFSGIIESLGEVASVEAGNASCVLEVDTGMTDVVPGESIAVNGVCLTATDIGENGRIRFFVSSETLDRTALGRLGRAGRINLERAVTPQTRLSGHMVQGHVDGIARLVSVEDVGDARKVVFSVPAALRRYMVEKGSVTLDGISLTLNEVGSPVMDPTGAERFEIEVMIIPHTWDHTTLGTLVPGDPVNVEVDVIAKYVESVCQYR